MSLLRRFTAAARLTAAVLLMSFAGPSPAAPAAPGSPLPQLQGPLTVTADEVVIDNSGVGLTARGHVRLTYRSGVATAGVLHIRRAERTAELTGSVTLTDPQGKAGGEDITVAFTAGNHVSRIVMAGNASVETKDYAMQADHITADRAAGRLLAERRVTLFMAPDLIVNGDRAEYDQASNYGVVTGHVTASNRAGRILGQRIEFFRQQQRATIHGPVTAEVYGATVTGSTANVDFAKSVAVISGHVKVVRRQGSLTADRVTIFYNTRRLVAEGATHAHFTDLESSDNP